ncbi:MAG: DUF3821 domain-containing protein, partial [Methanoregulaceae archaeon]|nr:DUF3821 domain-containing protein [Methanoregulaceae archaeon]
IMISGSPFQTGGVWFTGDYESGNYTVWAESTGNDMNLNYKREGKTVTAPVEFLLQSTNPLITPEPTTLMTTVSTTVPRTIVETQVPTTVVTESPATTPVTEIPTTLPATTAPGFGAVLSLAALVTGVLVLVVRKR